MSVIVCAGITYREAPIGVREQVAVPEGQLPERLRALKALPGVKEALLVSTCNRIEIWAAAENRAAGEDVLKSLGPLAEAHARLREGDEALRHMLRVAASLDSMVVGEAQILGQFREAAAAAKEAGATGPLLGRAVARAVEAARRVRTDTAIARGAVSLSSVAVELAGKVLGNLSGRSVLLLGVGEMGQLAAREMKAVGAAELVVANRSTQKAEELAREVGGIPASLEELPRLLERADVCLCSTGAPKFVVTREMVERVVKARRYRTLFLIDVSLPRNVEPSVNELENVYVYDLDDLERAAAENRDLRKQEIDQAEKIVEEALAALAKELKERTGVPVLGRLRQKAQQLAEAEVEKALSQLAGLDGKHEKTVRAMASAIVNKLLHVPTARLRAEAGGGPLSEAAAVLFDLQDEPAEAPGHEPPQAPPSRPPELVQKAGGQG